MAAMEEQSEKLTRDIFSSAWNKQLFCVVYLPLQVRRGHEVTCWTEVSQVRTLQSIYDATLSYAKLFLFFCHRLGLLESQLSYGTVRKISEHSNLGASITIGSLTGVMLKIR